MRPNPLRVSRIENKHIFFEKTEKQIGPFLQVPLRTKEGFYMLRQLFKGLFLTIPSLLSANDCWVEVEYLGWTSKETSLPIPLVTTASFVDPIPGAIGQPNTRTLLGQQTLSSQWQNGFRIDVGTWMFPECGAGFESNYFLMPTYTQNKRFFTSGEVGSPNFAVPIFDTTGVFGLNGIAGQTVFILPGPIGGTAGFEGLFNLSVSHQFQGAELDYIYIVGTNGCFGLDGSIGIEWIQLKESLTFQGATHTAIGSSFGSNFYNFQDTFKTDNNFVGGTIGFKTLFEKWNGSIETGIKLGIGVTNERVSIHGTSQTAGGNLFFSLQEQLQTSFLGVFLLKPPTSAPSTTEFLPPPLKPISVWVTTSSPF